MTSAAQKTGVIILFGGRSTEHEVSLLSARNVYRAIDRTRYQPILVGIDKQGVWRLESEATLSAAIGSPRAVKLTSTTAEIAVPVRPLAVTPAANARRIGDAIFTPGAGVSDVVVFPVLHGSFGEDGTVQGLLDLADLPYVGAGTLGSAIAMDKDVTKRVLSQGGIPVVPWRTVRAPEHLRAPASTLARILELGFPLFVKPANAGSSVGISKVKDVAGIEPALQDAFRYDDKVLCESGIDAREIECAVLGNDLPEASILGEIIVTHKDGFYSYDAKYVDPDGARLQIPADLPAAVVDTVRAHAIRAFVALELSGMARVDFFVDRKSLAIYFNEVNTIPGFTAISMYPKMWEASGVPITPLVTRLIELARERHARRTRLVTSL